MEQFGPLYILVDPSSIDKPENNLFVRLFQDPNDGIWKIKYSDGTIALFSSGITPVPPSQMLYSLFKDITTIGNIGVGEDTLYNNIIAANKFANNGDEIEVQYSINIADTLNTKIIRLYFAGIKIFESTNDYSTGQEFNLDFKASIIRVSSTDFKTIVSYYSTGITEVQTNLITPINPLIANNLTLTAEAVGNNDIIANFGKGFFIPNS